MIFVEDAIWVILLRTALLASLISISPTPTRAQSGSTPTVVVNTSDSGSIKEIKFSPSGLWLATRGSSVKLWEVTTGRLLRTLSLQSTDTESINISPDGVQIITSAAGGLKIWDAATGALLRSIPPRREPRGAENETMSPTKVAYSHDGRFLFVLYYRGFVTITDTRNWKESKIFQIGRTGASLRSDLPEGLPNDLSVSSDDRQFAIAYGRELGSASVVLFDSASGRVVHTLKGHTDNVDSLAFSPDGRFIGSSSRDNTVRLWDLATGEPLHTLKVSGASYSSHVLAISRDSKSAIFATGNNVVVCNAASGEIQQTIDIVAGAIAYSPDGTTIAFGSEQMVRLWDTQSREFIRKIPEQAAVVSGTDVAASPDRRWLVLGPAGLNIWDSMSGQPLGQYQKPDGKKLRLTTPVRADAQGHLLVPTLISPTLSLVGGLGASISGVWDTASAQLVRTYKWDEAGSRKVQLPEISPDGRLIALSVLPNGDTPTGAEASILSKVKLFDASGGLLHILDGHPGAVDEMKFSQDGKMIATYSNHQVRIWSTATGKLLTTIGKCESVFAFASSGQWIAISSEGSEFIMIIDAVTGRNVKSIKNGRYVHQIAVSPDDRLIVTSGVDAGIDVWETSSSKLIRTLTENPGSYPRVAISNDGRKIIAGNANGSSAVWDTSTGKLLTSTFETSSGNWITITPEGFFASSEAGAELVHVVTGFETTRIDQFYQALYRPDLVHEKLAGDPRGLVRQAAGELDLNKVLASGKVPGVRLGRPSRTLGNVDDNNISIEAEITDRGGGIGRVEWRVNGVTAGVDNAAPPSGGQPLRLARSLALDPGNNAIAVVAYNGANLIASAPSHLNVISQPPAFIGPPNLRPLSSPASEQQVAVKPRLYVLVAGINDYADQRIKLAYAVSDAREVARGFAEATSSLYQSVNIKLMIDKDVTREKLGAAFADMGAKVGPTDVFVFYLAGHGKTVDGRYFFIPQDFSIDGEMIEKSIDAAVKVKAIEQDQWQRWFASVPARKSLVLFDTCDSGTLTGEAAETQQLEKGAANDRLVQATGRSILTASGGSQEALEGYRGHGLFTYEILDAIDRADGDHNGTIEVSEIAAYVYAQVTALSEKVFKQRQAPQMKITTNYPLTKQTRVLQEAIAPIAEVKPAYQLAQTAQLQIQPRPGATVVRSLSAKTLVTVIDSKDGWSLIAAEGKPLGYVATRDLSPVQ